jgi:hypothetical protein
MTSKVPMPVNGDGRDQGNPDGVNESEARPDVTPVSSST